MSAFSLVFRALYTVQENEAVTIAALQKRMVPMWLFSHLVRMIRVWRRYDASLRELNRLGDRELADIGLSRSDIQRVAWENARI